MRRIEAHKQPHKLLISSQANRSLFTSEDKEKGTPSDSCARAYTYIGFRPPLLLVLTCEASTSQNKTAATLCTSTPALVLP